MDQDQLVEVMLHNVGNIKRFANVNYCGKPQVPRDHPNLCRYG